MKTKSNSKLEIKIFEYWDKKISENTEIERIKKALDISIPIYLGGISMMNEHNNPDYLLGFATLASIKGAINIYETIMKNVSKNYSKEVTSILAVSLLSLSLIETLKYLSH